VAKGKTEQPLHQNQNLKCKLTIALVLVKSKGLENLDE